MKKLDQQTSASLTGIRSGLNRLRSIAEVAVRQDFLLYCLILTFPLMVTIFLAKAMMLLDVIFPLGLGTLNLYSSLLSTLWMGALVASTFIITGILATCYLLLRPVRKTRLLIGVIGVAVVLGLAAVLISGISDDLHVPLAHWVAGHVKVLFDVFRWDLLFVLIFVLICGYSLSRWPEERAAARLKWTIIGVQVPLVLISSLEFAYYVKTGVTGSSQLFIYAVSNGIDILPIIASEMDMMVAAVLVAPLLLLFLAGKFSRAARRSLVDPGAISDRIPLGVFLWPLILLLALTPKLNSNSHFFQFEQNIHASVVYGIINSPDIGGATEGIVQSRDRKEALFDTRRLELAATEQSTRSNVILVILESTGANATSVSRTGPDNTPFLKSLAEKSSVVEQMYVVVPRTLAAWISILQGVYPASSNVTTRWGDKVEQANGNFASLPNLLRRFGYQSAFFTPTHLDYENEGQLIANIGFDKVVSKHDYVSDQFEIVNYFGWEDRIMTQPILDWVDRLADAGTPLFLTIMTNVGHHDYKPPKSWPLRSFDRSLGEQHNDYLNSLAYVDSFLGDLFGSLGGRGILDDSLIVVVGDHGESFGEHGKNHHMAVMYEESLHVPAIIYSSNAESPAESIPGLWQLPDLFPTVIDVLGYEMRNGTVAGQSVFQHVPEHRRAYFAGALDNSYLGMREGNLKYIYYFDRRPTEVFDIAADPEERHDISGTIDDATIRAVQADILTWYRSTSLALLGVRQ